MKKEISTNEAPKAPGLLSQAIVANDTIFVAGQIHMTADGKMVDGSVQAKIMQIMKNIEAILKEAGSSLDDIVKVVVYVNDMNQMNELNKHYPAYFNEPLPVREAVCVTELPLGASIEISVIASK